MRDSVTEMGARGSVSMADEGKKNNGCATM